MMKFSTTYKSLISSFLLFGLLCPCSLLGNEIIEEADNLPIVTPNTGSFQVIGGSGGVYNPPLDDTNDTNDINDTNNDDSNNTDNDNNNALPPTNDDLIIVPVNGGVQNISGLGGISRPIQPAPDVNNNEIGRIVPPTLERFVLPVGSDLNASLADKLPDTVSGVIQNAIWVILPVT